jgi:hypothetical protein
MRRRHPRKEQDMTKLEAWKAWCETAGTADLADKFALEMSSHGKAFSFAWDEAIKAEREACALVCDANAEACNNNSMLRDVLAGNAAAIRARSKP